MVRGLLNTYAYANTADAHATTIRPFIISNFSKAYSGFCDGQNHTLFSVYPSFTKTCIKELRSKNWTKADEIKTKLKTSIPARTSTPFNKLRELYVLPTTSSVKSTKQIEGLTMPVKKGIGEVLNSSMKTPFKTSLNENLRKSMFKNVISRNRTVSETTKHFLERKPFDASEISVVEILSSDEENDTNVFSSGKIEMETKTTKSPDVVVAAKENENVIKRKRETCEESAKRNSIITLTKEKPVHFPRKRSLSVAETKAEKMKLKQDILVDKITGNIKESILPPSCTKMPNFSAIHQKLFNKMESIHDHVIKKANNAKELALKKHFSQASTSKTVLSKKTKLTNKNIAKAEKSANNFTISERKAAITRGQSKIPKKVDKLVVRKDITKENKVSHGNLNNGNGTSTVNTVLRSENGVLKKHFSQASTSKTVLSKKAKLTNKNITKAEKSANNFTISERKAAITRGQSKIPKQVDKLVVRKDITKENKVSHGNLNNGNGKTTVNTVLRSENGVPTQLPIPYVFKASTENRRLVATKQSAQISIKVQDRSERFRCLYKSQIMQNKNTVKETQKYVKGVRSNRRFELQMKYRQQKTL